MGAARAIAAKGGLVVFVALVFSCGASGVYHRVKAGQTLSEIGEAYRVPQEKIARANKIRDPARIRVGERLWIPGAKKVIDVPVPEGRPSKVIGGRSFSPQRPADAPDLRWPIEKAVVSSPFGRRWGKFHDGIDISAPMGAAVRAAAAGEVVYDQSLSGYGKVIIIFHGRGYSTLYAHNDIHHVRSGERVRAGQLIAGVGRSGRTTGPNLHFEVRRKNVAHDPLLFLPLRGAADADAAEPPVLASP